MSQGWAGLTQNCWSLSRRRRSCSRRLTSSSMSSLPLSSSPSLSFSSFLSSLSSSTAWSSTSWGREACPNCWRSKLRVVKEEQTTILDIVGNLRMTPNKQTYAPAQPYQLAKSQSKPNQTRGKESIKPQVKPSQDKNMSSCAKPNKEFLQSTKGHFL